MTSVIYDFGIMYVFKRYKISQKSKHTALQSLKITDYFSKNYPNFFGDLKFILCCHLCIEKKLCFDKQTEIDNLYDFLFHH